MGGKDIAGIYLYPKSFAAPPLTLQSIEKSHLGASRSNLEYLGAVEVVVEQQILNTKITRWLIELQHVWSGCS